ncbi:MAG TPA: adenylate/guanylate cyclase domain-containing protein [Polyangiales bacterium]|nr:adenylate/guanylate cyclase domain-containing protein [Polyangiales bacterium]
MVGRITVIGPEGQKEWVLQAHNSVGRHPNNTVQVLDRIVSKEHCHIDLVNGRYLLRDLGSLNGTYVNGERVHERPLFTGDEITMGSTRIIVNVDYGREEPPTPGRISAPVPEPAGLTQPEVSRPSHATPIAPPPAPPVAPRPPVVPTNITAPQQPAPARELSKVTIAHGIVESHIRTKLAPLSDQSFLPESLLQDVAQLRRDYEKLRVSYDLSRAVGVELDIDALLNKIIDRAFDLLPADRGVVLLYDDKRELTPRSVRTKRKSVGEENVVLSTTIINEVLRDKLGVLSSDASVDARFSGAHSIIMQGIRSSMAVPLLYGTELLGIMVLDSQMAANAFQEKDLQLFQNVANQAAVAIQNSLYAKKLQQEALTRERFQRLLSPAIAEQVMSGKVEVAKGGQLRETTVLFSDIRGFTSLSESRDPQEVVDMLNEYFEQMVDVVFRYEGTLDKLAGDEIMALYGSPVLHPDDPIRAVRTALDMLEVLEQWNKERQALGKVAVSIGIGINSGPVVAGYLGSSKALEYTVIGDTVNVGSRLCSNAKPGQILVSEATEKLLDGLFELHEQPPIPLKGKSKPLRIYAVIGEKGGRALGTP